MIKLNNKLNISNIIWNSQYRWIILKSRVLISTYDIIECIYILFYFFKKWQRDDSNLTTKWIIAYFEYCKSSMRLLSHIDVYVDHRVNENNHTLTIFDHRVKKKKRRKMLSFEIKCNQSSID
jgi:hypothetical protein